MYKLITSVIILLNLIMKLNGQINVLPTIYWEPKHPIFKCETPTLRVQYGDTMNFFCPTPNINKQSLTTPNNITISENMYYTKDETSFNNCEAKDGLQLLRCDPPSNRPMCENNIKCPKFYNMLFRNTQVPNEVSFARGQTYYFIGTGFRTSANVDNVKGGSCANTLTPDENKMRLKIYICTDDEVKKGECERPQTEASYYQGCDKICNNWIESKTQIFQNNKNECFTREERKCTDKITSAITQEIQRKKIACPVEACSSWNTTVNTKRYYTNGKCLQEEIRTCLNRINGISRKESRNTEVPCPVTVCSDWLNGYEKRYENEGECFLPQARTCYEPWVGIKTKQCKDELYQCNNATVTLLGGTEKAEENEYSLYIVIAISASFVSLMLGLLFGIITQIFYQKKKAIRREEVPSIQLVTTPGQLNEDGGIVIGTLPRNKGGSISAVPMYVLDSVIMSDNQPVEETEEETEEDTNTISTLDVNTCSESKTPRASHTDDDDVFLPIKSPLPRAIQKQQRHRVASRQHSGGATRHVPGGATRQLSGTRVVLVRNVSDASAYQQRVMRVSNSDGKTMKRAYRSASNIEFVQHI